MICEFVQARLGISGTIRRTLISALFRRFMSYKASRASMQTAWRLATLVGNRSFDEGLNDNSH